MVTVTKDVFANKELTDYIR